MTDIVRGDAVSAYLQRLVNRFYKILPMWENRDNTLPIYLDSFQIEIAGCQSIMSGMELDADFISLRAILQYFIENPDCDASVVRREVFHAISVCNSMKSRCAEVV